MPLPATVLTALRRQQLVDLARAYEIAIPEGATKRQMLPSLITAEQQGVFKRAPKHPWYLQKAARTSDMPYVDIGENPEMAEAVAAPVIERSRPGGYAGPLDPTAPRLTRTGRKESDYHRKLRLLKERGVKAFGLSKQAMNELAAEHGIV